MPSLLDRLKQRKLIQWALAYVAGAWVVLQVLDVVADPWGLSAGLQRGALTGLALGFPIAVVLAWYHGERGHQRVTMTEVVILAVLLAGGGAAFVALDPMAPQPGEVIAETEPVAIDPNSIVVLPFRDFSPAGDQEYLGHGIAEQVQHLLHQIPDMRVISQNTAFAIASAGITTPRIADSLRVAHVLDGSIASIGDTIRVNAQLIDPRADTLLFSESFKGTLDGFFALQESVAVRVVEALELTLLGPMPTLERTDPEAYRTFLQAKHIADRSSDNYDTALPMFEEVLAVDPDHWPTLLEIGVIFLDWTGEQVVPFAEGSARAVAAFDRVLEIDPRNAYAHALKSSTRFRFAMDFEGGAALLNEAFGLGADHPEVLMGTGNFLSAIGRPEEAIELHERVRTLDPLYPINISNLASSQYLSGRYEEAHRTYRTLLSLSPSHAGAHAMLALTLVELGDAEGALAEARLEERPVWRLPGELVALHALGRTGDFEIGVQQLEAAFGNAAPHIVGMVYAYAEEHDQAFAWLDRAPPPMTLFPEVVTWLDSRTIADDPRWPVFRERVFQSEERMNAIQLDAAPSDRN